MGNVSTLNTGFIVLEHDLFEQTVDLATGYILPAALAYTPKLDIKPVISCLNKPMGDAYLETNDNSSNPLPTASSKQHYYCLTLPLITDGYPSMCRHRPNVLVRCARLGPGDGWLWLEYQRWRLDQQEWRRRCRPQ